MNSIGRKGWLCKSSWIKKRIKLKRKAELSAAKEVKVYIQIQETEAESQKSVPSLPSVTRKSWQPALPVLQNKLMQERRYSPPSGDRNYYKKYQRPEAMNHPLLETWSSDAFTLPTPEMSGLFWPCAQSYVPTLFVFLFLWWKRWA